MLNAGVDHLTERWTGEDRDEARLVLATYGTAAHEREVVRVQTAILKLSGSDLVRLHHFVTAAKADYRDVLWWADDAAR